MAVARPPDFATSRLAPNPGPMTLDGTNSWVLRAPGSATRVIVDPGPDDDGHLARLAGAGPRVQAIIVTHGHPDHVDGLGALLAKTGPVPVYAGSERYARGTVPLTDGERLTLAGLVITAIAAPGHTADSVCLHVEDGAGSRAVLTGDTILGTGTTVVAWPDGDLGAYLATLDGLTAYRGVPALPGHGPVVADCGAKAAEYRAHRADRLDQVRAAMSAGARTPAEVVTAVYPDLDPILRPAAEWTVRAALAYLSPSADLS